MSPAWHPKLESGEGQVWQVAAMRFALREVRFQELLSPGHRTTRSTRNSLPPSSTPSAFRVGLSSCPEPRADPTPEHAQKLTAGAEDAGNVAENARRPQILDARRLVR